jgi:hypothetical protein
MNMKQAVELLVTVGLLTGCVVSAPGHLSPVGGSPATQVSMPAFTFTGDVAGATAIVCEHPKRVCNRGGVLDGRAYQGPRKDLNPQDPAGGGLRAEWDLAYGPGFFVANVLGNSNVWHYSLTGVKGGSMEVEVLISSDAPIAFGVARDDQGNVFKLAF